MSKYNHIHQLLKSLEIEAANPNSVSKFTGQLKALSEHLCLLTGFNDLVKRISLFSVGAQDREIIVAFLIPEVRRRLELNETQERNYDPVMDLLDPQIREVAERRFSVGHFADSVEAAFKELNSVVKAAVYEKLGQEFDGTNLMERAFSVDNPVIKLADTSTVSGRNIQKGFLQIFSGAMIGIRNPKAHANVDIGRAEAIYLLFLASLLMMKLKSSITERFTTAEPRAQPDDYAAG